jgi:TolB protein
MSSSTLRRHPRHCCLALSLWMVLCFAGSMRAEGFFSRLFSKKQTSTPVAEQLAAVRSLSISALSGSTGESATKALSRYFQRHPEVKLVADGLARYRLAGASVSGRITATLSDRQGKMLFERTYGAPGLAENVEAIADDIVLAITGRPGTASSRIALVSNASGTKQVYVCEPDGSGLFRVTSHLLGAVSPALAPDGSLLAYTSYESGFPAVMLVELGGGMMQQLASTPGMNSGLAFAPVERRAALTMSFLGNPEIFVLDLGSNRATCVTESSGVPASPAWHPDGKLLAYSSDEGDGEGTQLYIVDIHSAAPARRWSSGAAESFDPEWSPDGTTIAFTARIGGDWAVATRPFAGGRLSIIQRNGAQHPTWSPDGRSVAYVQNGQLWVHDVTSGSRRSILRGLGQISEPRWMR